MQIVQSTNERYKQSSKPQPISAQHEGKKQLASFGKKKYSNGDLVSNIITNLAEHSKTNTGLSSFAALNTK